MDLRLCDVGHSHARLLPHLVLENGVLPQVDCVHYLSKFLFEGTGALLAVDELLHKVLQPLAAWNIIYIDLLPRKQLRVVIHSRLTLLLQLLEYVVHFDV